MSIQKYKPRALAELRAELDGFSYDGLVQLRQDLEEGLVLRGTWAGCVLSYRGGAPGSARKDRLGRVRNAFTDLWDCGWLTEADVLAEVEAELARRAPARVLEALRL
ncbi:MAG TPA: hypothetical protein VIL13_02000 [Longimicrobiales bacterium]